jgi:hypothetical protein
MMKVQKQQKLPIECIKDDHYEDPDGIDPTRNSSVSEISASIFASSVNSKNLQKDKQSNGNNNNNSSKKKENTTKNGFI